MNPLRQKLIQNASIIIAGCGALGNEVIKNLTLIGVRHLVLIDFDRVEKDNLAKSVLFKNEDAKLRIYKTMAAKREILNINPQAIVETIEGDIAYDIGLAKVKQAQVIISCTDNRMARYAINRLAMRAGIPWVDGGIHQMDGTVRVFAPGQNCYECNLPPEAVKDLRRRMPCAGMVRQDIKEGKAPTNIITASVIGAIQAQEAIKLLHKEELEKGSLKSLCGRILHYDGQTMTVKTALFKAYDDNCTAHNLWEPVIKTNISQQDTAKTALEKAKEATKDKHAEIILTNDCFTEYVERKTDGKKAEILAPGRKTAEIIDTKTELKGTPISLLTQKEYYKIDSDFPYPDITLKQLGIPVCDILQTTTTQGEKYLEMAKE